MLTRFLLTALVWLCSAAQSQAEVVFSDNLNDQAEVRRNWNFIGSVDFRSGQAAESGQAIGVGPNSYFYRFFRQSETPDSMQLTFWFRVGRNDFSWSPNRRSRFYVYWYGSGVSNGWYITELHRGSSGAGSIRSVTIDIPTNQIGRDNYVLFYNSGSAGYYHIDNIVVTRNQEQGLDHFDIASGGTTASVCAAQEILIEAKDSSGQLLSDYQGLVDISTSSGHGTWSMPNANNRFSAGPADSGQASYQFHSDDNGQLRLRLSNEHAESLSIQLRENSGSISSNSSTIRFSENAFVVEYDDPLNDDVIAYRNHDLQITMMKRDSSGNCGAALNYNRTGVYVRNIDMADDPGGLSPQLLLGGSTETLSSGFSELPISFSQGQARVQLLTRDVGHFRLDIEDRSNSFSDSTIYGSSAEISVRPFAFAISVPGSSNSLQANAPAFKAAGENFSANVSAVGWQPSDDTNNDGMADGHNDSNSQNNADLSNNPVLAAFGSETPRYNVQLSARSVAPLTVAHQELGGSISLTGFSSGRADAELNYSNAGIIEIDLSLGEASYLGGSTQAAAKIVGRSGVVGRFTADHFLVQNANVDVFCSASNLTHLSQPFTVSAEISARARDGRVLDAYSGEFAKLSDSEGLRELDAKPLNGNVLTGRADVVSELLNFTQGQATLNASLRVNKTDQKESPLRDVQLGLRLVDSDGIRLNSSSMDLDIDGDGDTDSKLLGSSDFYYSRLFAASRHGPETENLQLPLEIQSWAGHSFVRNENDSCSQINRVDVRFAATGPLDVPSNLTVPIAASSTTASFADMQAQTINFSAGNAGMQFSAPGLANRGEVEVIIDYSAAPWLSHDWNQNDIDDELQLPTVLAKFGAIRGHDLVVYWRENTR
ncbi:DUF6701 domain-containing protein [uncultured Pseudoteredinibacter sp.]|uniref:DUF6701 domain-containing protein n=1 Tax=uncultured Pseudoteredinibacter sp. TaxID=1641701 RepID=UPI00263292C1|nr:DUF6701 domain-containing protein [uncultured Pseudoteredinibacter sp.]